LRSAGAGRDLDGLLVDRNGGIALADIAEQQLGLARLRHHIGLGGRGRIFLGEIDRGLGVLAAEFQRGRPVGRGERQLGLVGFHDRAFGRLLPAALAEFGAVKGEYRIEFCGDAGFELPAERRVAAGHLCGANRGHGSLLRHR